MKPHHLVVFGIVASVSLIAGVGTYYNQPPQRTGIDIASLVTKGAALTICRSMTEESVAYNDEALAATFELPRIDQESSCDAMTRIYNLHERSITLTLRSREICPMLIDRNSTCGVECLKQTVRSVGEIRDRACSL